MYLVEAPGPIVQGGSLPGKGPADAPGAHQVVHKGSPTSSRIQHGLQPPKAWIRARIRLWKPLRHMRRRPSVATHEPHSLAGSTPIVHRTSSLEGKPSLHPPQGHPGAARTAPAHPPQPRASLPLLPRGLSFLRGPRSTSRPAHRQAPRAPQSS